MIYKIFHQPDLGLLLIRLFAGISMASAHGLAKLPPSEKFLAGVIELGFPVPIVFAWAAGLSEFLGGIFIALGLWTRLSSLTLGFTMVVAAFGRHAMDPFKVKELSLLYLSICILLLFTGAGKYSVDKKMNNI